VAAVVLPIRRMLALVAVFGVAVVQLAAHSAEIEASVVHIWFGLPDGHRSRVEVDWV